MGREVLRLKRGETKKYQREKGRKFLRERLEKKRERGGFKLGNL